MLATDKQQLTSNFSIQWSLSMNTHKTEHNVFFSIFVQLVYSLKNCYLLLWKNPGILLHVQKFQVQ